MSTHKGTIEIKGLTVTFSRWRQTVKAIEGVNLTVPAGQWMVVVGHNGSGKSTLLRAISGLLTPNGGEIRIDGDSLGGLSSAQVAERVFHVHQDPLLGTAPTLTLFENLFVADAAAQNGGASRNDLLDKYSDLLRPLGLADRLKQLARYLSGGERQLLALTVARLRPAAVMLLDEPLAALDPVKAELCLEQIKALNDEGKTILQVTHDPNLAISAGDRTLVLRQGRFAYDEVGDRREADSLRKAWSLDAGGGISIWKK